MPDFLKTPFAKLILCGVFGTILWQFNVEIEGSTTAWHIFSVFISVIICFISRAYPMGLTVMIGLVALMATKTISLKEALVGFSDTTVWLVIAAFLIASAVLDSGFGRRVALMMVVRMGKSMKGLAYAICGSEMIFATVIPSNTARGGGLHAPIVNSLSHSLGSTPEDNPKKAGSYLSMVGAHANLIAASMFMTGMAANPLVGAAAKEVFDIDFTWSTWALGAIVPGVCSLLLLPQLIYFFNPPDSHDGSKAQESAKSALAKLGPMQWKEKVMMYVLGIMLTLWMSSAWHGLSTTLVAWVGVLVLLLTNAQNWDDVLSNREAFHSLFWLGGLLTMATLLTRYGFIDWFVMHSGDWVSGMSPFTIIILLGLVYFYSMYAFSMLSGHIAAMVTPFFAVALAAGGEPMLAIAVFAYFSCLCGCLTNYSSGPIIIYFGLGYVEAHKWFKVGFIVSLAHIIVWLGTGLLWWKAIGWW